MDRWLLTDRNDSTFLSCDTDEVYSCSKHFLHLSSMTSSPVCFKFFLLMQLLDDTTTSTSTNDFHV